MPSVRVKMFSTDQAHRQYGRGVQYRSTKTAQGVLVVVLIYMVNNISLAVC